MASKNRLPAPAVVDAMQTADPLQQEAGDFSFFQALRLLRLRFPNEKAFIDNVRIRPHLALGFPQQDINYIAFEKALNAENCYRVEANFFGLYGVTSPLPTFYTEDLIDEQLQGYSAGRDFLDILHASLYPLLFRTWEKHRIWIDISERREVKSLQHLQSLIGIVDARVETREQSKDLLRYAGLFNQYPRSALGLQQLVQSVLSVRPVEVVPCVEMRLPIDRSARNQLGIQCALLGENCLLGGEVMDRSCNLDIRIGALTAELFHALLPGQALYQKLERLVTLYLTTPLRCRLVTQLAEDQQRCAALGEGWQRLGLNTWLGVGGQQDELAFILAAA